MRIRADRLLCAAVAVAVNAVFLWLLVLIPHPLQDHRVASAASIEIVWIVRAPDVTVDAGRQPTAQPVFEDSAATRRKSDPERVDTDLTNVVVLPHQQGSPRPSGSSLDLRLPEADLDFRRNPLERSLPINLPRDRMRLTFRDRSFGGWVQRLSRSSICSELRRSLQSASASGADVIVDTMKQEGCLR